MNPDLEPMDTPASAAVEGVEALCTPDPELEKKELALCSICLQWTCEGPHCHRPGVCEDDAA
jgi:hypothetical protein